MTIATGRPRLADVSQEWRDYEARAEELRQARAVLDRRLRGIGEELKAARVQPPTTDDLARAVLDGDDEGPPDGDELRARYRQDKAKRDQIAAEQDRHQRAAMAIRAAAAADLLAALDGERGPLLRQMEAALKQVCDAAAELVDLEEYVDRQLSSRGGWGSWQARHLPLDRLQGALKELRD